MNTINIYRIRYSKDYTSFFILADGMIEATRIATSSDLLPPGNTVDLIDLIGPVRATQTGEYSFTVTKKEATA